MKNKHQRKQFIIDILSETTDYITIENIASLLHVSKRTIHSDLIEIEKIIPIDRKSGRGIRKLDASKFKPKDIDLVMDRRLQIAKMVILDSEIVTYATLAQHFFVSFSSIYGDINWLKEKIFKQFSGCLVSDDKGTYVKCDEKILTNLYINVLQWICHTKNIIFHDERVKSLLQKYLTKEIVESCWKVVASFEEYTINQEADYYLLNIYLYLSVRTYRLLNGNYLTNNDSNKISSQKILDLTNYFIANDVLELIKTDLSKEFIFKEIEILNLSIVLKANKISFIKSTVSVDSEAQELAFSLISEMSKLLGESLIEDAFLKHQLELHCYAMLERIRNGIVFNNPMLHIIKQEYHFMFEFMWIVIDTINHELAVLITEDEVGFIMLYFQAEMEKRKRSHKIIVVCPNGMIASNLIAMKLREVLPPLDIIEVTSIDEIQKENLDGFDFIISTQKITSLNIPTIDVSMLLTAQDIEKIKQVYNVAMIQKSKKFEYHALLPKYLHDEDIYFSQAKQTKEEVIHFITKKLLQRKIVKFGFEQAILERENISSTEISSGGAIPHASVQYVNQTRIILYVTDKEITWSKYGVKVIVFFVLAEKDLVNSKKILQSAFSLIKTREIVNMLSSAGTKENLLKLIYRGMNDD